jgi:hypothetical protein
VAATMPMNRCFVTGGANDGVNPGDVTEGRHDSMDDINLMGDKETLIS